MSAPNRATFWAQVFVDELARGGLRAVCIAPGSRSTPLVVAFAAHPDIRVYSHLDERSAAFFALGLGLASGIPAAVLCTSGTAAANFHPAVIEAHHARVPLLVLTADRSHELRNSGANQTIDQVKLYGGSVRWFVDVAPPEAAPPALVVRSLRTTAARALAAARGMPPGPVHLNFPFRKPLEPTPVPGDAPEETQARPGGASFTRLARGALLPTEAQIAELAAVVAASPRGLIVCGPNCPRGEFPAAVGALARVTGYPLLADALSGVRFGAGAVEAGAWLLAGYETSLRAAEVVEAGVPEVVLHFGATPTSAVVTGYLSRLPLTTRRISIQADGDWRDDTHTLSDLLWADPETVCRSLAERLDPRGDADPDWGAAFRTAEAGAWAAFEVARAGNWFEGAILADVVELLPPGALLYTASSLPVRHLDTYGRPRREPLRTFANRGASGIDGTISSALGAAASTNQPLVLVTGDVAFYHDLNGLLALRRCGVRATIVLIHNDGGGIFRRLPIAQFDPPFTELFLTPHGLDFEPAVRMFGAEFVRVEGRETFREALRGAVGAERAWVIEVRVGN